MLLSNEAISRMGGIVPHEGTARVAARLMGSNQRAIWESDSRGGEIRSARARAHARVAWGAQRAQGRAARRGARAGEELRGVRRWAGARRCAAGWAAWSEIAAQQPFRSAAAACSRRARTGRARPPAGAVARAQPDCVRSAVPCAKESVAQTHTAGRASPEGARVCARGTHTRHRARWHA